MSKLIAVPLLLLMAGLLLTRAGAYAEQPEPGRSATARQLPAADEKGIRDILKEQETAWNRHDMAAFTRSFRDDADGINVVGMYWRGKAAVLKHLSDYHATVFKDLEETIEEVTTLHPIDDAHAIAVSIWKVGSFKSPGGVEISACRHRSTLVLAKGPEGWKVVHFHNTIVDEAAVKGAAAPPKK